MSRRRRPRRAPSTVSDLELVYTVRGIDRPVLRGVSFSIERGRSYGLVGESGLRQVDGGARNRALPAAQRPHHRRQRHGRGQDVLALGAQRASRLPRTHGVDGLPEPRLGAEPGHARRRAGRRGVHRARRPRAGRRTSERATALGRVQIADPGSRDEPLPAPALRRHAAARRDRDGARQGSGAADPRRAHHRPRRDGRGRGPRPRREAPGRARHGRALHQPQPRRDLEDVRPRRACSTPGASSRKARSRRSSRIRAIPYTVGLLRCIPRGGVRKDHGRLDTIPGFLPSLGADDHRLRLRRPLRARRRPLPHRGAAARRASAPATRARCFHHDRAHALPREEVADLALPAVDRGGEPLLRFDDLGKVFKQRGHDIHALVGVSAAIWPGETLGLVGESGSGKTTLARTLLGIVGPTIGRRRARRRGARAALPEAHEGGPPLDPDRLPESRLGAQPASLGAAHPAPLDEEARRDRAGRRRTQRVARARRARSDHRAHADAEAGSALRRPQAARRDRPRLRRRPEARRLRRADLGARRLGPGGDPQPARRAAGRAGRLLPLHLARPRRRPLHLRPDRRALPRPR